MSQTGRIDTHETIISDSRKSAESKE